MTFGLFLVVAAAVLAGLAAMANAFGVDNQHVYPVCLALAVGLGFLGVKLP